MGNKLSTPSAPIEYYLHDLEGYTLKETLSNARFMKTVQCVNKSEGCVAVKVYVIPDDSTSNDNSSEDQSVTVAMAAAATGGGASSSGLIVLDGSQEIKCHKEYLMRVKEAVNRIAMAGGNVCAVQKVIESDKACFMVRQYFSCNLEERLSILPFLSALDKRWITYQMLSGLAQLNSVGLCHGDIKPENVLLTTTNWAILTDIACCKPVMIPTASSVDFSFFFDSAGKRTCCIAPERFYDPGQQGVRDLTHKMDIFSLGCTIASFYLEGAPLFNLSQLLEYRRGAYDKPPQLQRIQDDGIRELVTHMTQRDPEKRFTAEEYIRNWTPKLFPKWFENLRMLGAELLTKSSEQCVDTINNRLEDIVNLIAGSSNNNGEKIQVKEVDLNGYFPSNDEFSDVFTATGSVLSKVLASEYLSEKDASEGHSKGGKNGLRNARPEHFYDSIYGLEDEQSQESNKLLNEIRDFIRNEVDPLDGSADSEAAAAAAAASEQDGDAEAPLAGHTDSETRKRPGYSTINTEHFIEHPKKPLGNEAGNASGNSRGGSGEDEDAKNYGASLLAPYLAAAVRSCIFPTAQIKGLQLFVKMSEYISDECKLQWCVPYIVAMFSKYEPIVRASAISALTRVLATVRTVTGRDTKLFPEFITPALRQVEETDTEEVVMISLASNLASLISTAHRFLEAAHKRALELLRDVQKSVDDDDSNNGDGNGNGNGNGRSKEEGSERDAGGEAETLQSAERKKREKERKLLSLNFDKDFSDFSDSFNNIIDGLITRRKHNSVMIAFLRNAGRICATMGQKFTSEKLLPLLISFMNEKDWRLIEALLHNIVGVAAFIGQKNFEEFILPWTQQGFLTREDFVVEQGLSSMAELCRMGLLSHTSMTSLAQKWAPMLLHPNAWVRSSTVGLFAAIAKTLGPTDAYCFLLPALTPFLQRKVEFLTEETILQALRPPVPLSVFNKVKDAIVGLFKGANRVSVMSRIPAALSGLRLPDAELSKIKLILNYMIDYCEHYSRQSTAAMNANMTVSQPSLGMMPAASLPGSGGAGGAGSSAQAQPSQVQMQVLQKTPNDLTYFASLKFPVHTGSKTPAQADTLTINGAGSSMGDFAGGNSGPSSTTTSASSTLGYDEGGLDGAGQGSITPAGYASMSAAGPLSLSPSISSSTPASARTSYVYSQPGSAGAPRRGSDANWGMQSAELGRIPQRPTPAAAAAAAAGVAGGLGGGPPLHGFKPAGVLIGDFNEHTDAVNCVCASRSGYFFASASEDCTVKIWDCNNVRNRSKYTYNGNSGPVTALTVIDSTNTVACGYETGGIHLVRIDYDTNISTRPKYRSSSCIQGIENLAGRVVCMDSWAVGSQFVVPYGLSSGLIAGLDIRSNENGFSFSCEPKFGQLETFAVGGDDHQWLVAGTSRGYYILWDLRFCVPAYFWRQPSKAGIRKIVYRGDKTVVACAGIDDIISWDVSTASITQINRVIPRGVDIPPIRSLACINTEPPDDFAAEEIGTIANETKGVINEISESLKPGGGMASRPRRVRTTAMFCAGNYIISGGDDMCLRYWDDAAAGTSYTISCDEGKKYSYSRSMIDGCTVQQAIEGLNNGLDADPTKDKIAVSPMHKDTILDITATDYPCNMLITAGKDGKVKVWK